MKIGSIDLARWNTDEPAVSRHSVVRSVGATPLAREAAHDPLRVRLRNLSADGQQPTAIEMEATIDESDLVDANFVERCNLAMNCIGRIQADTPAGRAQATGFMVAPGLLMTNHHVLPDETVPIGGLIQFGYRHDVAGGDNPTVTFALEPERFFVADEELDFAVVAVAQRSTNGVALTQQGYLRLNPDTGKTYEGRYVTILQHPDGDYMQIALRENQVIRASQDEYAIRYRADTAHGSSGAPVFNDSFQVAALHSGGRIERNEQGEFLLKNGSWVASVDDRRESEVVWEFNVGIRISRICPLLLELAGGRSAQQRQVLATAMAGGDVLSNAIAGKRGSGTPIANLPEASVRPAGLDPVTPSGGFPAGPASADGSLVLPLALRVSLVGAAEALPAPAGRKPAVEADQLEAFKFQIPIIYDSLETRTGFRRDFLDAEDGTHVPMPRLTQAGKRVAAPLLDGSGPEMKYHKFSVWMHKGRRLALFTASNVDFRDRKKVVDGKKTDRDTLAGFPPDKIILEQWVDDPRVDKAHQLPDVFYSEDRGAFDKGHLVRRDDVCWGATFQDIQMGNGDTYHVTNCSPQISQFNQGDEGKENWGDLESFIQKATKADKEKVVVYAGPIFRADDRWFHGKDNSGAARVQVPSKFWKVVVNRDENGYGAYGFVIAQDVVGITEDEFFVTSEWKAAFTSLRDINKRLRGWVSLQALLKFDRFDEVGGNL